MQIAFGETQIALQYFGRDFRCGAEQEDGDFDAGRCWGNFFRCSVIDDRWVAAAIPSRVDIQGIIVPFAGDVRGVGNGGLVHVFLEFFSDYLVPGFNGPIYNSVTTELGHLSVKRLRVRFHIYSITSITVLIDSEYWVCNTRCSIDY